MNVGDEKVVGNQQKWKGKLLLHTFNVYSKIKLLYIISFLLHLQVFLQLYFVENNYSMAAQHLMDHTSAVLSGTKI